MQTKRCLSGPYAMWPLGPLAPSLSLTRDMGQAPPPLSLLMPGPTLHPNHGPSPPRPPPGPHHTALLLVFPYLNRLAREGSTCA